MQLKHRVEWQEDAPGKRGWVDLGRASKVRLQSSDQILQVLENHLRFLGRACDALFGKDEYPIPSKVQVTSLFILIASTDWWTEEWG